jgi:hypothetical protein
MCLQSFRVWSVRRVAALGLCALLTACASHSGSDWPALLLGGGSTSDGSVLWTGKVTRGEVLGYAFPEMKNASDAPITIKGFRVDVRWTTPPTASREPPTRHASSSYRGRHATDQGSHTEH